MLSVLLNEMNELPCKQSHSLSRIKTLNGPRVRGIKTLANRHCLTSLFCASDVLFHFKMQFRGDCGKKLRPHFSLSHPVKIVCA